MSYHPTICTSFSNILFNSLMEIVGEYAWAEIRMDLLSYTPEQYEELFASHPQLIATNRSDNVNDTHRLEMLEKALQWGAKYIDIEIETADQLRDALVEKARTLNKKIIISYHNFIATPSLEELHQITQSLFHAGADIAKIACMVNHKSDNARILSLYSDYEDIVSIGMGKEGTITRVAAPLLGAPFTFASHGDYKTAPGQITAQQLKSFWSMLENTAHITH